MFTLSFYMAQCKGVPLSRGVYGGAEYAPDAERARWPAIKTGPAEEYVTASLFQLERREVYL